jgi:serralysin
MWGDFQNAEVGQPTFGQDTFVFAPNNGNDIIHDYQQGFDNPIELDGFFQNTHIPSQAVDHAGNHGLETFAELNIEVVGNDSIIHFDANNSVTVLGVTGLTAHDFSFVV